MVAYTDTRIYEIDFLNYSLMTPETYHYTTSRGAILKGLGFKQVHHLKNLFITNNKTKNLFSGTCPIHFLPTDVKGTGTFKLSNITFDPYVADFTLESGEMDGFLCGFNANWHKDTEVSTSTHLTASNYNLEFENIKFISPAISYNLACAGLFTKDLKAINLSGDYWGIYLVHHTENLIADNIHGIFRDDLHTVAGRLLVTNLIHEEAEIGSGSINRDRLKVTNSSCYKKSGDEHVVYKCHRIGTIVINSFEADNCKGLLEFYGGATIETRNKLLIKKISVKNGDKLRVSFTCTIEDLKISNFNETNSYILNNNVIHNLEITDIKTIASAISITTGECTNLIVTNVGSVTNSDYGLLRSGAQIKNIQLTNIVCDQNKLIECLFETLTLINTSTNISNDLNNFIFCHDNNVFNAPNVYVVDSKISSTGGVIFLSDRTNGSIDFKRSSILNSGLISSSNSIVTVDTETQIRKSYAYTPPLIDTNKTITSTFTFIGVVIGDIVQASFNQYHVDIEISAVVSNRDTVTVKFKNTGANPVNLASGAIVVKKI